MIALKKCRARLLVVTFVVLVLVHGVGATALSFLLRAGEETTRVLNLAVDDHVTIKVAVTGEPEDNLLDFYATDPAGSVMKSYVGVALVSFNFVCSKEGAYTMHFSNVNSTVDKVVSFDYEVDHYILGMPQMLFMTLVIVGVCLVMVAVFFVMAKPH